ncbi:MAG: succinate dehydrogenase [Anaerolineae bacterium]|jgi:succinate dehydrogenase / fumarate reductase, membrane anchor subunit
MTTYSGVTHRKVQVQSNFERLAFLFMRLTGIGLIILAVGHVLIQHVLSDVHNLTLEVVAATWNAWGWKVYDMLLLAFAIPHGINGLRNVLEDYVHNRQAVKVINVILAVFVVVTLIWAGFAIASFNPSTVLN